MKHVALILAVYIGVLSFMPCFDGLYSCDGHTNTAMTEQQADHQHNHESDGCTPFCVCSCCGTLVVLSEMKEQDYFILAPVTICQEFRNTLIDQHFLNGVWHPPAFV